jgi:hypothetical protein
VIVTKTDVFVKTTVIGLVAAETVLLYKWLGWWTVPLQMLPPFVFWMAMYHSETNQKALMAIALFGKSLARRRR